MIYLILALLSIQSNAAEQWFCTEGSSHRNGQTIHACGIGQAPDEATARIKAFDAAKEEFTRIAGNAVAQITPKRTTCEFAAGLYTCHRMLAFEISTYQPFYAIASDAVLPTGKIRIGMTSKELVKAMGKPLTSDSFMGYTYEGARCGDRPYICFVRVDTETHRVVSTLNIAFEYMEEL